MSKVVTVQITSDQLALIGHALLQVDRTKINFKMCESFMGETVNEELDALTTMCLETAEEADPDIVYGFCV